MKPLKYQPIVSTVLVAINAFVFVACHFSGERIYSAGGLSVYSILVRREYGRILWSIFLHSGMDHLFNNMLLLFFLGSMIEKEIGHVRYAVLYFLSGIGGNILSLWIRAVRYEMSTSLGASGAVFGLDGALLAMALFWGAEMENVTLPRVALMIFCSLYNGFMGKNIDNAAHVGGLLTGFLVAGIMCMIERRKRSSTD